MYINIFIQSNNATLIVRPQTSDTIETSIPGNTIVINLTDNIAINRSFLEKSNFFILYNTNSTKSSTTKVSLEKNLNYYFNPATTNMNMIDLTGKK